MSNSKIININLIIYVILITIPLILQYKFFNYNYNHFDTGIEFHDTYRIFLGDINHIFQGHVKLIKLAFVPLFFFENIYIISFIYFIIQTLCILSPLFFLNDQYLRVLFIFNPLTWIFLMGDFHYDYLLIPLFFFIFSLSNKNKNYEFLSILFILIKEHFFIFPFVLGIINYIKYRNFNWLFLSGTSLILKLFFLYLIYSDANANLLENNIIFPTKNINLNYSFKGIVFFLLIFINIFLIIPNVKNIFNVSLILILISIYLLFYLKGQRLGVFSHYYVPFFVLFFFFYSENLKKKFFKIRLLISIIFLIVFSISLVSISFWQSVPHKTYSYLSFVKNFNEERLDQYDFKDKTLMISNTYLIPEAILSKKLRSFSPDVDIDEKFDFVLLSKKNLSYGDKICFDKNQCQFIRDYITHYNEIIKNYKLDKETKNYFIFKNTE